MSYDDMKLLFFPDEDQETTEEDQIEAMQAIINDGSCWQMEGHVGRTAADFIEAGLCTLGDQGHRDYYGNYVPSKTEVEPGTKGSQEFVDQREGDVS